MEKQIKTFEDFSNAVEQLAGDRYFAVKMEKTGFRLREQKRDLEYKYYSYVDGFDWHSATTPEGAVGLLRAEIMGEPLRVIDAEIK